MGFWVMGLEKCGIGTVWHYNGSLEGQKIPGSIDFLDISCRDPALICTVFAIDLVVDFWKLRYTISALHILS
ncbi:hypothetical protein Nepgr_021631 [Nepenthes gracilis]|uniref:Uncharacterized protein n=1 Tax=Nepenthes gracilis TaxID=150966 RepID=A0AAD3SXU0_NEPGR|nr:hypothetical protein Nepgr_021631 [Nepenthes gracilis]